MLRAPGSVIQRLTFSGTSGDDTVNLGNLEAVFAGIVGGDAGAGNDTLRLTGSGQALDLTAIDDANLQGIELIDITGSGDNTLKLNVNEVLNLSPTTDVLRVQHNSKDSINYGSGWVVELPQIVNGQFVHVLKQGNATVEVLNTRPFNNPYNALDTNHDGSISPIDALVVINHIIASGPGRLTTPVSVSGLTEFFFVDANNDEFVSAIDVLVVINRLNDDEPPSEGEGALTNLQLAASSTSALPPSDFFARPKLRQSIPTLRRNVELLENNMTASASVPSEDLSDVARCPSRSSTDYNQAVDQLLSEEILSDLDELFVITS